VHNTQPWRFRFVGDAIELRADPSRGLCLADPDARELVISCGAALCTLELAIRGLGLEPRTRLLPDEDDPRLLARVQGLPGRPTTREERLLLVAITRRHTHRDGFTSSPADAPLLDDLRFAARRYGGHLKVIYDAAVKNRVIELAWAADSEQHADISWRAELMKWANRPDASLRDGVPADAYPRSTPGHDLGQLPGRDFALGRGWGTDKASGAGPSLLCALSTDGEGPRAWLQAGAALQNVLLHAANSWVFAKFATQPLELPDIRLALREAIGEPGHAQMLFQLGHADTATLTPRRPVRDVLDVDAGPAT
jgi:nitroreductase